MNASLSQDNQKVNMKTIVYLSLIILTLDMIFVAINYFSSRDALYSNFLESAKEHQQEFELTLQMTYRNMMQMSQFISQDEELNQIFLQGKKAVEREGGGSGGTEAARARQALLNEVKPAWDQLTEEFDVRQLHYQLGPGSLSFLRVHKPQNFGDRMDDIRYTIVDTNAEKTPRFGFETGRIYSGLRGVSPIWTVDPESQQKVYVGALESGTSFKQILPIFAKNFRVNVAVLLDKKHVESKMWPQFIDEYFANNPDIDFFLESSSSDEVKSILSKITVERDFAADRIDLITMNTRNQTAYYFPLRDYQGTKNPLLPPAGFVLLWEDATKLVDDFTSAFTINIVYALLGCNWSAWKFYFRMNSGIRPSKRRVKASVGLTPFFWQVLM